MTQIHIYGLVSDSIVDGPGLRYGVFVQGCTHRCPGCHNPQSQPAEGGTLWTVADLVEEISHNKLTRGVTISGGEPFEQAAACAELAEALKARDYDVWVYSGYRYEELVARAREDAREDMCEDIEGGLDENGNSNSNSNGTRRLLAAADVLVDGPFVQSLKSYGLHWCGSSNQRVIDLQATRDAGDIVLYRHEETYPEKPVAW